MSFWIQCLQNLRGLTNICGTLAPLQTKLWGSKWETQSKAASPRPPRFTESSPQCDFRGRGSSFSKISALLACRTASDAIVAWSLCCVAAYLMIFSEFHTTIHQSFDLLIDGLVDIFIDRVISCFLIYRFIDLLIDSWHDLLILAIYGCIDLWSLVIFLLHGFLNIE